MFRVGLWSVSLHCKLYRSVDKLHDAVDSLPKEFHSNGSVQKLDLASFLSIKLFAKNVRDKVRQNFIKSTPIFIIFPGRTNLNSNSERGLSRTISFDRGRFRVYYCRHSFGTYASCWFWHFSILTFIIKCYRFTNCCRS